MKIHGSITGRLLASFFIVALVPTVFLTVSVYYSAEKYAMSSSENLINEQFSAVSSLTDQMIVSSAAELSVIKKKKSFHKFLRDKDYLDVIQEFKFIMQRNPEFLQIKYIDKSGMELLRVNRTADGLVFASPDDLHDKSDKYYFRQAVDMSERYVYVSGLDPNTDGSSVKQPKRLVARLGIQVIDGSGLRGILLINLDSDYIFSRILPLSGRRPGKAMLISESGSYVEYDGSGFVEKTAADFKKKFGVNVDTIMKNDVISQKRVLGGYLSVLPIRFDYSGGVNVWYASIFRSDKEIHSAVLSVMRTYLISLSVIFAGILIFTLFVSRGLISRVRHLVGFIPVAAEKPYTETGIAEFDEIGHAIRTTAQDLKNSSTALARLNTQLEDRIAEQVEKIAAMAEKELEYQAQLRDIQAQLMHADRLASLGMISAAMAHEIGNPLAAMKTSLEVLRNEITSEEDKEFVSMIILQVDRLGTFLRSITKFGAKRDPELKIIHVARNISEVTESLLSDARKHGIIFNVDADDDCVILFDEIQLRQVIFNVLINSVQELKTAGGGDIFITLKKHQDGCVLKMWDSGKGAKNTDKMFDPFYTTKSDGTGLGLAIVRDIAKSAGWQISAENRKNGGLMITVIMKGADNEK